MRHVSITRVLPVLNVLCLLAFAGISRAGDDKTLPTAAKPSVATATKPAPPLTEREQWLLEKVELLEKRVAELEAHESKSSTREASSVTPAAVPTATSASASNAPGIAPAASAIAVPVNSAIASSSAAPIGPPQDQASAAKPKYVEPFSDADWTWLNGNARTKDVYWDTKFFTPEIRADVNYRRITRSAAQANSSVPTKFIWNN